MISRTRSATPLPHFPLRRLGLCLDCDECFPFGARTCPACGSESLVPLARFLPPVGQLHRALEADGGPRKSRHLFIVARDRVKLYEYVKRAFAGNDTVEVILDRREGERRREREGRAPDRRRGERRRVDVSTQLRALGWAIVVADLPGVGPRNPDPTR